MGLGRRGQVAGQAEDVQGEGQPEQRRGGEKGRASVLPR